MQHFSIIFVASLLSLALLPHGVLSRTPRDGVDLSALENQSDSERNSPKDTTRLSPDPEEDRPSGSVPQSPEGEETVGCSGGNKLGCKQRRQEAEMDQEEYRRLRIEVIKQKILQKLKLKAPPQVRLHRHGLPSLLLSNSEMLMQDANPSESSAESSESASSARRGNLRTAPPPPEDDAFYGTTRNVFVFPDNSSSTQIQCSRGSSVCLVFRLPQEAYSGNLASSYIWLYKQASPNSAPGAPPVANQTLVVSEVIYDRQFGLVRSRILSLEDDTKRSSGGWLRLRVDRALRRWVTKPHVVHALEVSCKGCGVFPVPLTQEEGHQPFLVLTVSPPPSLNRRRREIDCTNTTSRCCRETFYLSFKEISWDEWIIQPPGYTANYCRGTCLNDVSNSRYHHTTVMSKFLENQRSKNEEPLFSLCCTPSTMSPISLIYVDEDSNLFQKSLPNMVVESCDCA